MTQLKGLQSLFNNTWIGTRTIDSFPAYYNYQIQAAYYFSPDFLAGVYTDYTSTGGRVDYKDYSGEMRNDMTVSRIFDWSFDRRKNFQHR